MQESTYTLLKPAEMRRKLGGISGVTEWRWTKRGIITPIKINGRNFYKESDIALLMSQGKEGAA